jgi:hypothetical protein
MARNWKVFMKGDEWWAHVLVLECEALKPRESWKIRLQKSRAEEWKVGWRKEGVKAKAKRVWYEEWGSRSMSLLIHYSISGHFILWMNAILNFIYFLNCLFFFICFEIKAKVKTKPRLAWDSWSSCLLLSSARILGLTQNSFLLEGNYICCWQFSSQLESCFEVYLEQPVVFESLLVGMGFKGTAWENVFSFFLSFFLS